MKFVEVVPNPDGYPPMKMPKCTTEYAVQWDSTPDDDYVVAGSTVEYWPMDSLEDAQHYLADTDWHEGENARIVARITTEWVEVE